MLDPEHKGPDQQHYIQGHSIHLGSVVESDLDPERSDMPKYCSSDVLPVLHIVEQMPSESSVRILIQVGCRGPKVIFLPTPFSKNNISPPLVTFCFSTSIVPFLTEFFTIFTVGRGNLDHFFIFRIILKIFPVIFLPIFFYIKSRMNYGTSYIKAKNHGFVVGSTIFFFLM